MTVGRVYLVNHKNYAVSGSEERTGKLKLVWWDTDYGFVLRNSQLAFRSVLSALCEAIRVVTVCETKE